MRSTQQLSITLPNEMAEFIRAKVATGEYAYRKRSHPRRIADIAGARPRCRSLAT